MTRGLSIACLAMTLLLASCATPHGQDGSAEAITDFVALYAGNCAGCHGADGRYGAAQRLNDAVYQAFAGKDNLRRVISAGVPPTAMPPFSKNRGGMLTDEQIEILVEGMQKNWGVPRDFADVVLPSYVSTDTGDPHRGQAEYKTFCARCHGSDGRGESEAGSIVDESFLALVSDQALRTSVVVGCSDEGVPDWRSVADQPLSSQQISDIVAWLASHRSKGEPTLP
jgi:mono/diheme cytochrome c family protein